MKIKKSGESISAETYKVIRGQILSGELAPSAKVTTSKLCDSLGVSLGAVREALSRLRAEGLVSAEEHRGYRIAPISVADIRDLSRVRIEIESLCIASAIEHGGKDWEAGIVANNHLLASTYEEVQSKPMRADEIEEIHQNFHRALVAACDSPRLLQMRQQYFDEAERYRRLDFRVDPKRPSSEEHGLIAEVTLARNTRRAQALLAEHISHTSETLIKALLELEAEAS